MTKKLLVEETWDVEILEESAGEGKPKHLTVRGIYMESDVVNGNGRLYPRAILERETQKLQEKIKSGSIANLLGHPPIDKDGRPTGVNEDRVCARQKTLNMSNEGRLVGESTILKTGKGQDLEAMVAGGLKVGLSARGYGSTKTESKAGKKVEVVGEDYELLSFDFVLEPSFASAGVEDYVEESKKQEGDNMDPKDITLEVLKEKAPEVYEALRASVAEDLKKDAKPEDKKPVTESGDETPSTGNAYVATFQKVVQLLGTIGIKFQEDPAESAHEKDRQGNAQGKSYGNDPDAGNTGLDANKETIEALKAGQDALLKEHAAMKAKLEKAEADTYLAEELGKESELRAKVLRGRVMAAKTKTEAEQMLKDARAFLDEATKTVKPTSKGVTFVEEKKDSRYSDEQLRQMRYAGIVPKAQ